MLKKSRKPPERLRGAGEHGFGLDTAQTAQTAGEGIDAVGVAFDDEGNDRHIAVAKRKSLPTQHYVGEFRDYRIDFRGSFTIQYEQCYCSYSLLHQVLGFWVRRMFYYQMSMQMYNYFLNNKDFFIHVAKKAYICKLKKNKTSTLCTTILK